MSREMVSGPDLGAGFLFQLSLDHEENGAAFTYHAQNGGVDANGPPKGSPEPFGFAHPTSACMFGGPSCWERRFELPPNRVGAVRQAYNRMRFVMAAQLAQQYDHEAPAFEPALKEFVQRVAGELERHHVPWRIGGSTGAWLRGAKLLPNGIDIGTTADGVDLIGERIPEYLIEPVATTEWSAGRRVHAGRAFVGTLVSGCRTEWASPTGKGAVTGLLREWTLDPEGEPDVRVEWDGHRLPVAPLEFAVLRSFLKSDADRFTAIAEVARDSDFDRGRLELYAMEAGLSTEQTDRLTAAVRKRP